VILTLLLQAAASTPASTPITVYVTLGAAVLAALASLNATRVSSKTAREVATLAAQTTRDSARIAAETTREVKNQDYKNDYYKKVIDKRMDALEAVEKVIGLFGTSHIVGGPGGNRKCHSYFVNNVDKIEKNGFNIYDSSISSSLTWRSVDTSLVFKKFMETVIHVTHDVNNVTDDNGMKLVLYTDRYDEINDAISNVERCIGKDMEKLYDVEAFLKERFKLK